MMKIRSNGWYIFAIKKTLKGVIIYPQNHLRPPLPTK
jgi:hypothetical protein